MFIRNIEPTPELTAGYKKLDLVDDTQRFIDQFPGVVSGSLEHKVLVVGRKLKKRVIALITIVGLVVSVAVGVGVGFVTQNPAPGISVSSGMIAAITVLVTLCVWMTK